MTREHKARSSIQGDSQDKKIWGIAMVTLKKVLHSVGAFASFPWGRQ
jgi:hypothetical protein